MRSDSMKNANTSMANLSLVTIESTRETIHDMGLLKYTMEATHAIVLPKSTLDTIQNIVLLINAIRDSVGIKMPFRLLSE